MNCTEIKREKTTITSVGKNIVVRLLEGFYCYLLHRKLHEISEYRYF